MDDPKKRGRPLGSKKLLTRVPGKVHVYYKHGMPRALVPGARASVPFDDRTAEMIRLFKSGLTLSEIGAQYGCTREWVRQLVRPWVPIEDGGLGVRKVRRQLARRDARSQYWEEKYGITLEQREEIIKQYGTAPFLCWREQRRNVIREEYLGPNGWHLTFAEWWAIWQDSGVWEQRGLRRGSYILGRIDPAKNFSLGNVIVRRLEVNSADKFKHGFVIKPGARIRDGK